MRAPGAAIGVFALEIAMDELAYAAGIDPLELRLINYAEHDQNEDKPFTSKALRACYAAGRGAVRLVASASRSRARCATGASWSAGAWPPASGRR